MLSEISKLKTAVGQEISLFIKNKRNQRTEEVPGILEEIFSRNGALSHLRFKKKKGNLSVVLYLSSGEYEIVKIEDIVSKKILYLGV